MERLLVTWEIDIFAVMQGYERVFFNIGIGIHEFNIYHTNRFSLSFSPNSMICFCLFSYDERTHTNLYITQLQVLTGNSNCKLSCSIVLKFNTTNIIIFEWMKPIVPRFRLDRCHGTTTNQMYVKNRYIDNKVVSSDYLFDMCCVEGSKYGDPSEIDGIYIV